MERTQYKVFRLFVLKNGPMAAILDFHYKAPPLGARATLRMSMKLQE